MELFKKDLQISVSFCFFFFNDKNKSGAYLGYQYI